MMKTKIILIILSTLYLFLFSKSNPISAKIFELEYLEEEGVGRIQKFLANVKSGGSTLTTEDCLPNSTFQIKKVNIKPPEIISGGSVHVKAIGAMTKESNVVKLSVDAKLNGVSIFGQDIPKTENVKKGLWFYEWEIGVPTFVPKGHWDIYCNLIDDQNVSISCLKAMFDT